MLVAGGLGRYGSVRLSRGASGEADPLGAEGELRSRPVRRAAAIALLSASGLLLQVSLTRVLSLVAWHHFTYLIISLALLGIGAAGSFLTRWGRIGERSDLDGWIARWAWLFAVSTIASLVVVTRLRFEPIAIYQRGEWSQLLLLAVVEIAIAAPYFFAGAAMGAILAAARERVGAVYSADLVGGAGGCLLALALLNGPGGISAIAAASALAAIAAVVLAGRGARRAVYAATALVALSLAVTAAMRDILPIRFPPSKLAAGHEAEMETIRWNVIARIDVTRPILGYSGFAAGLGRGYPKERFIVRTVFQDGAAPTYIVNPLVAISEMEILAYYLQGLPYVGYARPEVLVIGSGGGADVLIALHHGAARVTGVEVNPATAALLRTRYLVDSGYLVNRPDVEIRVAEGRHFLTAETRRFDVIQLSGVDTFTALSSGAYALTENFLYTVEAIHSYLDHVRPGGVVSVARWLLDPPRETLRLVSTALRALEERGESDAPSRFLIVGGLPGKRFFPWAETLLKAEPFTQAEIEVYRRWSEERGFTVLYDPFETRENVFDRLIRADAAGRDRIVDTYVYDISPSTDDNPFFFQFYRWRNLLRTRDTAPSSATGVALRTPRLGELPIGLVVLFSSILLIVVLSVGLIALPLRRGAETLRGAPWRWGVVAYFALIGLGFMFVEIALLQKLTVFLGGPTYSMAVTLSSLLLFTGMGAALSSRVRGDLGRALGWRIAGLVGVLAAVWVFLEIGVPRLLGLGHATRCVVAVGAIAPMGLVLGIPFPVGLRLVGGLEERLVPWAYGINGCASVLGGMLCIVVGMAAGLSVAWGCAVLLYVLAAAVAWVAPASRG